MAEKRPPDYKLQLKAKTGGARNNEVGVGWANAAGGITLVLNPGIVLTRELCEQYFLTLWPVDGETRRNAPDPSEGAEDHSLCPLF